MTSQSLATARLFLIAGATSMSSESHSLIVAAQQSGVIEDLVDDGPYIVCPQVPSLHCFNGSTCLEGTSSIDEQHAHLNLKSHESGYYCDCLPGFIGHDCGVQVEDCGDPADPPSDLTGEVLTSCYHGSKCQSSQADAATRYYCDCDALNAVTGPTSTKYAGNACEHASTSTCAFSLYRYNETTRDYDASNHQFCTNGGTCTTLVHGNDPHPGCVCREGWTGSHCEAPAPTNVVAESRATATAGKIMLGCYLVAIAAIASYLVVLLIRFKREKVAFAAGGDGGVVVDSNVALGENKENEGVESTNADESDAVENLSKVDGGAGWKSKEEEDGAADFKIV